MLALRKKDRSLGGKRASQDTRRNVHEEQLDKVVKAIAGLLDMSPKKRKEIKKTLDSGSGVPLQVRYRPVNSYSSSYIHDEDMSRTILVNGVEELLKVGTGRCASWQEAVIQFLNPPGRPTVPVHGIVGEKNWMDDLKNRVRFLSIFLNSRPRICCSASELLQSLILMGAFICSTTSRKPNTGHKLHLGIGIGIYDLTAGMSYSFLDKDS